MPVSFFSHKPKLTKKRQNDIRQLVISQIFHIFQIHFRYLQSAFRTSVRCDYFSISETECQYPRADMCNLVRIEKERQVNSMANAKKLPSGSWRVRVYAGKDASGRDTYRSFTAPSKREAEYLAAEFAAKKKAPDAQSGDMKLSDAYQKYIEIKRNTLSPATVREYLRAARCDFPELMPLRLSKITQAAVQSAVNVMAATHSPKSVRNSHGLLSAVLRMYAPEIRLNTRLPQPKKAERGDSTDG